MEKEAFGFYDYASFGNIPNCSISSVLMSPAEAIKGAF